jgi:hypothetical protein
MTRLNLVNQVRPYTTKELAAIYGVCDRTFKNWLKPFAEALGPKQGRFYSVIQVKIIFEKLGVPSSLD